jgi:hypothetical protein
MFNKALDRVPEKTGTDLLEKAGRKAGTDLLFSNEIETPNAESGRKKSKPSSGAAQPLGLCPVAGRVYCLLAR